MSAQILVPILDALHTPIGKKKGKFDTMSYQNAARNPSVGVQDSTARQRVATIPSDRFTDSFVTNCVEHIVSNGQSLAYIIRAEIDPKKTTFLTPSELKQQVGFVVYPAGGEVKRHVHRALERHIVGTSEVIVVRKGRCQLDVYNDARELVASRELYPGDIMLMTGGGHGFRMHEDTVLLEVKQGPYTGIDEKEHF